MSPSCAMEERVCRKERGIEKEKEKRKKRMKKRL